MGQGNNRRRLLVVNFFPAFFPPSSGGEQRYYYLYHHLSERFDVTLLSPDYSDRQPECVEHTGHFREYRIPKSVDSDRLHWRLNEEAIGPECSALVVALTSTRDEAFAKKLTELAVHADAIIHEFPYTLPYDLGFGNDGIPRVYNSHNVEFKLASQILQGDIGRRATLFIRDLERELVVGSELVYATCEEERHTFIHEFRVGSEKIKLAPNGFELPESGEIVSLKLLRRQDRNVVFMGSAHPPNVEALRFIATKLAPGLPDIRFKIIGSVGKAYTDPVPANVEILGILTEDEKNRLLDTCTLAINPLFTGAGTNLKMLDYMAHGAPIVSTSVGARGLSLRNGEHLSICDEEEFISGLQRLLADSSMRMKYSERTKVLANERYTWAAIASRVANELDKMFEAKRQLPRRPKLVSVCDYPVDQPSGGGQVRVAELSKELGCEFDVVLICLTDERRESRRAMAPGVVQRAIPKTQQQREEEYRTACGEMVSITDILSGKNCVENDNFVAALRQELSGASVVIFEQCYLAPLLGHVPAEIPVVYSSHNVEMELKRSLLAARRDGSMWLADVEAWEKALLRRASLVVCVSDAEAERFKEFVHDTSTVVIKNGVRVGSSWKGAAQHSDGGLSTGNKPVAIFLGSGHPPNISAAKFILQEVAPRTPEVTFLIVGGVCDAVADSTIPSNVELLGFLPPSAKTAALLASNFAVNPVSDGGGSSLKVPDFFAAGLPVVSFEVGMRGYDVQAGRHYILAVPDNFALRVAELAAAPERCRELGAAARGYAEDELNWSVLGKRFRRQIKRVLASDEPTLVLVLTYRFSTPPRGGAETFLLHVLEKLGNDASLSIDVAAPMTGTIRDHLHFSAIYGPMESKDRKPQCVDNVHYFPLDKISCDVNEVATRLFSVWMAESLMLGIRLAPRLVHACLLGGWNNPEVHDGKVVCWMSDRAQVRIPARAKSFQISGFAPREMDIQISQDGAPVGQWKINGSFHIDIDLLGEGTSLQLEASRLTGPPTDPRLLSFLATSMRFDGEGGIQYVDLSIDLETLARRLDSDAWVKDLIAVTEARSPMDDALFCEVRGPHSSAMTRWLGDHIAEYDVVIAQGVPFATSVLGATAARKQGVPLIVLPHFHMEDRYYHWRSYYDAFRQADRVIAAPAISKPAFFDRIGARSVVLPGGGLNPADFTPEAIARGRAAFRSVHKSDAPFVLVLGRKAGGKNYRMVMEAVGKVGKAGHEIDMVMIGPDDDGVTLPSAAVQYYGAQPREVVIGALAEALCLANMSTSESFGIVLLEAWMAGTPVVARRSCVAFRELVQDGMNGFVADTSDEVAAAIIRYFAKPDLAEDHASKGRETAEKYTWTALADGVRRIIVGTTHRGSSNMESLGGASRWQGHHTVVAQ